MFKNFSTNESRTLNHSGRSLVGETLQLEGDLRCSGSVDVSGLVNGNVFVSNITTLQAVIKTSSKIIGKVHYHAISSIN